MDIQPGKAPKPPQPFRRRAYRKHEWLTIYTPMFLGFALVVGLGVLLWQRAVGSPSVWSDISLIFLLILALGAALIVLALVVALAVGLVYAIRWLPLPALRGRHLAARADELAHRGAAYAIRPIVLPKAGWAGLLAAWRTLISIFRSPRRGKS